MSIDEARLTVSLPCKPDRAKRAVNMGNKVVDISMVGCEAQGAMYALSYMTLDDPSLIASTLTLWRAAMRAQLGLPVQENTPVEGGVQDVPFARKGALSLPQAVRMRVRGHRPDGSVVQADAIWFARLQGASAQLVHAVVYADKIDSSAADYYFESITLQLP